MVEETEAPSANNGSLPHTKTVMSELSWPLLWICSGCEKHVRSLQWVEQCPECGHGNCYWCNTDPLVSSNFPKGLEKDVIGAEEATVTTTSGGDRVSCEKDSKPKIFDSDWSSWVSSQRSKDLPRNEKIEKAMSKAGHITLERVITVVTAGHLRSLLWKHSTGNLLLLDTRTAEEFSRSRIKHSVNISLPETHSEDSSFKFRIPDGSFSILQDKDKQGQLTDWKSAQYLVAYDRDTIGPREGSPAARTLKPFFDGGCTGEGLVLQGGYAEFSKRYPMLIENGVGAEPLDAANLESREDTATRHSIPDSPPQSVGRISSLSVSAPSIQIPAPNILEPTTKSAQEALNPNTWKDINPKKQRKRNRWALGSGITLGKQNHSLPGSKLRMSFDAQDLDNQHTAAQILKDNNTGRAKFPSKNEILESLGTLYRGPDMEAVETESEEAKTEIFNPLGATTALKDGSITTVEAFHHESSTMTANFAQHWKPSFPRAMSQAQQSKRVCYEPYCRGDEGSEVFVCESCDAAWHHKCHAYDGKALFKPQLWLCKSCSKPLYLHIPSYRYLNGKFWFEIFAVLEDGKSAFYWRLSRCYQDFRDLHLSLLKTMPGKVGSLFMPDPIRFVTENVTERRRLALEDYLNEIFKLKGGNLVTENNDIRNFFRPWGEETFLDFREVEEEERRRLETRAFQFKIEVDHATPPKSLDLLKATEALVLYDVQPTQDDYLALVKGQSVWIHGVCDEGWISVYDPISGRSGRVPKFSILSLKNQEEHSTLGSKFAPRDNSRNFRQQTAATNFPRKNTRIKSKNGYWERDASLPPGYVRSNTEAIENNSEKGEAATSTPRSSEDIDRQPPYGGIIQLATSINDENSTLVAQNMKEDMPSQTPLASPNAGIPHTPEYFRSKLLVEDINLVEQLDQTAVPSMNIPDTREEKPSDESREPITGQLAFTAMDLPLHIGQVEKIDEEANSIEEVLDLKRRLDEVDARQEVHIATVLGLEARPFAGDYSTQVENSNFPELSAVGLYPPKRESTIAPILSKLGIWRSKPLRRRERCLRWTCCCGYEAQDVFEELEHGAAVEFANDLIQAGYITRAQVSNQSSGRVSELGMKFSNFSIGVQRRIRGLRSSSLPQFVKQTSVNSLATQCLPIRHCRWLHLCIKKRPYATKLAPLHVCKDEEQNEFTDASFFKTLRDAYWKQRTWSEKLLFRLRKIEFVEFELCPENFVDCIIADRLPPTIDEYDFHPPPPLKKIPPIGSEHMMHLFTSCTSQPSTTSLYLRHIPKRKENALSFLPDKIEGNTGWGLHFVEGLNSSLAVTVMFVVSLVLGVIFAVCWTVYKKDVQGAFGVAAYVTSVMTLAVMSWQMWAA